MAKKKASKTRNNTGAMRDADQSLALMTKSERLIALKSQMETAAKAAKPAKKASKAKA